jgi:chromosome segregation ATPase
MSDENIKTDVEILKRDVSNIQSYLPRLDAAIEKITELSNSMSKMLAIHSQTIETMKEQSNGRHNATEKELDNIDKKIDHLDEDVKRSFKSIIDGINNKDKETNTRIDTLSSRLTALEKWKWLVVGASMAIGYAISNQNFFQSIMN